MDNCPLFTNPQTIYTTMQFSLLKLFRKLRPSHNQPADSGAQKKETTTYDRAFTPSETTAPVTDKQESAPDYRLERFLKAQEHSYSTALHEITLGQKRTHWIWYIFPQLTGLGHSANSQYYGISGRAEAQAYLNHPVLGKRLREITAALLTHRGKPATDILGGIDARKVRSCLTLFDAISPSDIFHDALQAFYQGSPDRRTLTRL